MESTSVKLNIRVAYIQLEVLLNGQPYKGAFGLQVKGPPYGDKASGNPARLISYDGVNSGVSNFSPQPPGFYTIDNIFLHYAPDKEVVIDSIIPGGLGTSFTIPEGGVFKVIVNLKRVRRAVDLKINNSDGPVSVLSSLLLSNNSATLSWISKNADSCVASGDWSGIKATSGSESTGNLTQ